MKKDDLYLHKKISDVSYLLPFGQKIADFNEWISLNESSSYLVDLIEKYGDKETVKQHFFEKYDISSAEREAVSDDISYVLSQLKLLGAVNDAGNFVNVEEADDAQYFKIGKIVISVSEKEIFGKECGLESLIHDNFKAFSCEKQEANQKILLVNQPPIEHLNGNVIVRTDEIVIIERSERYILLFPGYDNIYELHVSKDGQNVIMYFEYDEECSREMIFHALRFAFLIAAKENGMYVLHSASILYNGKAWLFSGKSGEGKSTQTQLWNKYKNTPFLNGDLNMIGFENEEVVVYGLPWCGTSEVYTSDNFLLGGIIFIIKDSEYYVEQLSENEKKINFLQRIITPLWNEKMLVDAIQFSDKLTKRSELFRLHCTKDERTVNFMAEIIDKLHK